MTAKPRRDNLSKNDLIEIAKVGDADFEGSFSLKDTGKDILDKLEHLSV